MSRSSCPRRRAPEGPYDDAFGSDGLLRYRYRGTDPEHADNRGLRTAMTRRLPLAYFHGVAPGRYLAAWPVYIVGDNPRSLAFSVAVDDVLGPEAFLTRRELAASVSEERDNVRREYVTAAVRVRLHQRAFRERVLEAFRPRVSWIASRLHYRGPAGHHAGEGRTDAGACYTGAS